jgi:hypothetical protein
MAPLFGVETFTRPNAPTTPCPVSSCTDQTDALLSRRGSSGRSDSGGSCLPKSRPSPKFLFRSSPRLPAGAMLTTRFAPRPRIRDVVLVRRDLTRLTSRAAAVPRADPQRAARILDNALTSSSGRSVDPGRVPVATRRTTRWIEQDEAASACRSRASGGDPWKCEDRHPAQGAPRRCSAVSPIRSLIEAIQPIVGRDPESSPAVVGDRGCRGAVPDRN